MKLALLSILVLVGACAQETKIVCIGDSITYGKGIVAKESYPRQLARMTGASVINAGISGDTTQDMEERFFSDVIAWHPTHVVIMGGTNDLLKGYYEDVESFHVEHTKARIASMVQMAQRANIVPIVLTVPPKLTLEESDSERYQAMLELNAWILRLSGVIVLDAYAMLDYGDLIDGTHLAVSGADKIAKLVQGAL